MNKKPYQPPPNKAARLANTINMRSFRPDMTGTAPQIDVPKQRPKPRKAANASNQWLFVEADRCRKAKKVEKEAEIEARINREEVRQRLDAKLFDRECRRGQMEVWES